MRRLRILTWHVHGNYLYNLAQIPHELYLVRDAEGSPHRTGRSGSLPWGEHVHDAPVEALQRMDFDVVVYQSRRAWEVDRLELLSEAQRRLPRIVIEHDPPQQHPSDTRHWCDDPGALLVQVTPFNALMWDAGATPVRVIEHGVRLVAPAVYEGDQARGIVVVNHLAKRGRRLGRDVYERCAEQVPLTLVGMGSTALPGGAGEVDQHRLPGLMARHRWFFNPIRWTSMGLAVVEAMTVGLPIVALATTEMATVIRNGENGWADTRLEPLVEVMRELARDPVLARRWGEGARRTAAERFGIERFVADWNAALRDVAG
ncbi:MAG TPA: glycosyltransferase family 4 protein [Methylibium sp.]|uniref:glycosyltransferase n=1 Tax=Methylibium sp. TaxID=2067992 RepID=UPI002DBED60F|nr:glycosyltransferase family 4 protein [Methylibium sp.]HEU4459113.1 glycosyltransferase family 4 protein [Methylibium sp.]